MFETFMLELLDMLEHVQTPSGNYGHIRTSKETGRDGVIVNIHRILMNVKMKIIDLLEMVQILSQHKISLSKSKFSVLL